MRRLVVCVAVALASACTTAPDLPSGEQAYLKMPVLSADEGLEDYRIGPLDEINITVFQEPELSLQNVQVDAAGSVLLPLIGNVMVADRTTAEVSKEIAGRLSEQFLVDPQVSVIVASSVAQKVTVEGAVETPGVYEIKGRTSLLEALAMAKGPSRVAALEHVAVFREIDGERVGALFDLKAIRRGEAADPQIRGNDTVVVGLSNVKAVWRDVVAAMPALAIFRPLGN